MPNSISALGLLAAPQRLHTFDLALVAVYLVGITLFGLRFRKKSGTGAPADRSLRSYFLANNTIPWWAISLSIVSAETSTLTIISIPGVAFAGDFGFLQLVIGYLLGRVVVAALFLPRYFAGEMLTAYQLIDRRFGPSLHKVTAGLFLLTRAAAEGVRVFAVSIVVGIAIGTRDVLSIAIISLLTLLYTFEGGMTAVIWTDVVQMAIYIGGTFVAIATLGSHITGGWSTIHTVASAAGKFHMLNFALNLTTTYTFWAGILGGTFLTMASHGTDQLMVQRMLAARNLRESQVAILTSGIIIFIQFALFLLIGAGLYVFYGQHPAVFASADRIFPTFIVREMPIGIAGLLVAAILAAAMSNLSAALNSLSSTTVVDFYMHFRPNADNRERAIISKSSTVLWALVLFAIAVYSVKAGGKGHVVEIGLSIASVAYGCLLGVFLLGTLTRFATQTGATIGMVFGFVLNLWLWQGNFPAHLGPVIIPHIAFTWYVLIGAVATFAVGSLASLLFHKQSKRTAIAALTLLALALPFHSSAQDSVILSAAHTGVPSGRSLPVGVNSAESKDPPLSQTLHNAQAVSTSNSAPDFAQITQLINDAIAAHKLPGAVVLIGHNGHIVFEHAYGDRKLAGEPGLDGKPSPAEPMTEDTIFDMASLTKDLATAPAIMQLYEAGKIASFDDPIEKYLPAFNPAHDPQRAQVTIRMLLTHTSGEAPDVDLKDAWGLAKPDKAEGFRRALTTPLKATPGSIFEYSDINFIILGDLVESLSGAREDVYAAEHIFTPLGMAETGYHPFDRVCGPVKRLGANTILPRQNLRPARPSGDCMAGFWALYDPRIAPTVHDNEGNPTTNPDFDHLLRGTVDDPTTRRMGGVAGHAGVFSTAHDVSVFAQTLLDSLAGRTSDFPLEQSRLQLMTTPEQPATVEPATILTLDPSKPTPTLMPTQGIPVRGFGWDINSAYSRPRGAIFPTAAPSQPSSPTPSFGHTGYTGTSLWIDPDSDTYVILLSNSIHPRGNPPISNLRGQVATAAAEALHLYASTTVQSAPSSRDPIAQGEVSSEARPLTPTLTGIDVLEQERLSPLLKLAKGAPGHGKPVNYGLLTNQTGIDSHGIRTVDVLRSSSFLRKANIHLATLFSPEHGIFGAQDSTHLHAETDPTSGLQVTTLYGPTDADKRPSHAQLKDLDAVVIDLQDAGVRFYTYETVVGYFLEAAAQEQTDYHHDLEIIILDRPDLIGGEQVQGPTSDPNMTTGPASYINYMSIPLRHGLTLGELARYINGTKHLNARLTVIPMQHWSRSEYFDQTSLPWHNPSPNLQNITAATLYPGLGFLDYSNVSVGRGTSTPFELFGAAWLHAPEVVAALTARHIPGVTFAATTTTVAEDANHYPFHGQTIDAVRITVTNRKTLDSPELGIEILSALHRLYPAQFQLDKTLRLLGSRATLDALHRNEDPRAIAATWVSALNAFKSSRAPYLLYP